MKTRREIDKHGHERIVIYRTTNTGEVRDRFEVGMECNKGGTWIHRLGDFGHAEPDVLKRPLGFLYPGEDAEIVAALSILIAEREAYRLAQVDAEALRRKTCTKTQHFGFGVDLSCAVTYDALTGIKARKSTSDQWYGRWTEVEIEYHGQWMVLARTDLKDDVCTGCSVEPETSADEFVQRMRDAAAFGARLKQHGACYTFAVVDQLTDG